MAMQSIARSALALGMFFSLTIDPSFAQVVDCSNPDNLCTGDPCVTTRMEVQTPCVVDFGARTLIIGGTLVLPDASVLDLTAASIEIPQRISGRSANGPQITLTATNDVFVDGTIDASGRLTSGSLTIDAGGNIALEGRVTSRPLGGPAPGGTVTIHADGALTSTSAGKISVKAGTNVPGGQIDLSGDLGVTLAGGIDARGDGGGSITISSAAGPVAVGGLTAESKYASGGTITVTSATSTVVALQGVRAGSSFASGGSITIGAAGAVTTERTIGANGSSGGGTIIISGGSVDANGGISARSPGGTGGTIDITSSNDASFERDVRVDGDDGGCVRVTSALGSILVEDSIKAEAESDDGGRAVLDAGGDVTITGDVEVTGRDVGGSTAITGVNIVTGDIDVRGDVGGTIEANATGNLTTAGSRLRATLNGCIELTAGGTLDASGDIDPAHVPACPAPPTACPF